MMKKITLLLTGLLLGLALNAQIVYFGDDFVAGDMTQWTTIDADGDGSIWAPATSASMGGDCLNSDSWAGGTIFSPDNYLVTANPIAFPTVADLSLKFRVGTFQINGTFIADEYSVYLSTGNDTTSILAGTLLYNGILSDVMTADQADGSASFFIHDFDMSAYQGQSLYLSFRHHNTTDENSVLIGNVSVESPFSDDLVANSIVSPVTQGNGCQLSTETVTGNITNNGLNDITTFDATYVISDLFTGATIDSVTETITIPALTAGSTTDFDFVTMTSDLSGTDSVYNMTLDVSMTGDQDLSSDSLFTSIASIATQTIPYSTSFEIFNEAFTQVPEIDAWGWSFEDANGNGNYMEPTVLGAVNAALLVSGDCALFYGDAGEGQSDDWSFSPCLALTSGQAYRIKFQVETNQFTTGDPVVEVIEVAYGMGANSTAMTVIEIDTLDDHNNFKTETYDFVAPSTGDINIGIHKITTGVVSFLSIDDFSVEELLAASTTVNSSDVDPCTGLASVSFSVNAGDDYFINWGDGTTDTVTSSPATHTYTATGVQNIIVTASNAAGSSDAPTTVDNTLTAPDAAFGVTQNGSTDVTVSFAVTNTETCNTYAWDFGDGNTGTGNSANNEYVANGTYTVTLTATNASGSTTSTQEVTVMGIAINEIAFVNGISVFPNPATDVLNVAFELNNAQDVEISLVSIDGKVINTSSTNNTSNVSTSINTTGLATGLYILDITTTEGKYTRNVMVK